PRGCLCELFQAAHLFTAAAMPDGMHVLACAFQLRTIVYQYSHSKPLQPARAFLHVAQVPGYGIVGTLFTSVVARPVAARRIYRQIAVLHQRRNITLAIGL